MALLPKHLYEFLKELKENNSRDWMNENKKSYQDNEKVFKEFYAAVVDRLNENDEIEKTKVFRINRDVRFSKDKTPYNVHRSVGFSRAGAHRRGGYYLRFEPGKTILAGGFFNPEPVDLLRIRKEFELGDSEIRTILAQPEFKNTFGGFSTENQVKTAPKGFSKDHEAIDLIRNKAFIITSTFTDKEVFSSDFIDKVVSRYSLMRPFFDYMSDVLTTDLNGVSILEN